MRRFSIAAAVVLALVVSGLAIAATIKEHGGAVTAVYTATATDSVSTQSTSFVDVPGMQLTVHVGAHQKAMLVITFSAESLCEEGTFATNCFVTATVDGFSTRPDATIFDSGGSGSAYRSNSMQFVAGPISAGDHVVKIRYSPNEATGTFFLQDRTLTALRSKL